MSGVTDVLDDLALNFQSKRHVEKAGSMASTMIRNHIYRGDGFDPLSPATTAYRGEGRPLLDTAEGGGLIGSITHKVTGKDTVSVGTVKEYARIQNNGGTIKAGKKGWLFIPATGTRQLEKRYGKKPSEVLSGLRADDYSVYRAGRTVCYRKKGRGNSPHVVYYLKKSVTIPARRFFYLSDEEMEQILMEIANDIF